MKITRKSIHSGITRTKDLDVTEGQMKRWLEGKELVQNVFPNLSADDREFIVTGITSEEWDEMFSEEDNYKDERNYDENEPAF